MSTVKRIISFLLTLTMLVSMFTFASANELGTIAFFNAADNTAVTRLDGVDNLYANVTFTAKETGIASVMAAHYNIETGALTAMEFINSVETTEGAVVEYTTPAINVAATDLLKVFAWDEDSLAPLATTGTIDRLLLEDLPTATVTELDVAEITDVPLTMAMNFKADPATEAQLAYYSNWYADYELTVNKDVTFNLDGTEDGYLAGQYDAWSAAWVQVPKMDVTVEAGKTVKIMETAAATYGKPGLKYTYGEVYSKVKDFDCGVYFTPEFLKANDGLEVTLALKIYNPANEAESFVIGDVYTFNWTLPTATVTELDVSTIEDVELDFALNFKADDVTEEQIAMFADWYADYELTVNKTVTFNADGTADGFLSGQYDTWSKNWVSVPTTDATLDANTPVRVMETAAALMGQSGLKLTCADIYTSVKDFNCGLAFSPEFLVANPDLEVKLSLKIYNPANEEEFYIIGSEYIYTPKTIPSIDKFIAKEGVSYNHTLETAEAGKTTFNFEDLFTVIDGVPVDMENLTVTGATYADGKITVDGFGAKTITVTDNYYCNTATVTVMVNEPANVDKFTGKTVTYTHTLATIDSNVAEFDFEDLFDVNTTYPIKAITLEGATYVDGKVVVEGIGTFTVTATDNYYCNTATATVTVIAPENATKWTATNKTIDLTVNTVGQDQTVNFTDLFTTVDGAVIKAITVTVDNGGSFADGVITVPGKAGTYTVTATDDFYCNPVTATITVNDAANVDKFTGKTVTYTHTLATIESNSVTYNFADLFTTNNAYPVKDIVVTGATYANGKITVTGIGTFTVTATDNYYCNTATATVTVIAPENATKWTATNKTINLTVNTVGQDQTVNFTDLFTTVDGAVIKAITVTVDNGGSYANGVITVPGKAGTYTVTATDNFYCNPVSATITVKDAANVDKFTGKSVTYTHTLDTIEANTVTYNFADLFTTNSAYPVKDIVVTGGTYANGKITITGTGTKTITATDNYYCNTATATVTINAPSNVTKWTAKSGLAYETDKGVAVTKTLGELFSANGNKIKDANVTITGATFTKGATWDKGTVTFNGEGTYTVTITDGFYCTATSATVTITEIEQTPAFGWTGVEQHPDANGAINPIEGVSSALAVGTSAKTITVNAPYAGVYLVNVNTTASAATTLTVENQTEHYATFDVAAGSNKWALSGTNYKYILLIKGENTLTVTAGANATLNNVTLVALKGQGIGGANAQYTDYRSQLTYNTFESGAETRISLPLNQANIGVGKTITYEADIPEGYYTIRWTNGQVLPSTNTTIDVKSDTGFYRELKNKQSGWSDYTGSDGKGAGIYFRGGKTTVTVTNTGSQPFAMYDLRFYPVSSNPVAMDCLQIAIDSTIPEGNVGGGTVTPTPTPTPDVGSEPTAPAELTGATFAAAIINPTNMNIGADKAEFGYQKDASMTVKMGVPANGTYQLSALFSSNANYVQNSAVTKVYVDGVEVTSFPQSNKVNPNWSPASGTIELTKGDHEITLSTNTAWNLLYIHGLKLEAK